jgi:integrase
MALTDIAVRKAKLAPGKSQQKLTDEKGLHLLLTSSGTKLWRFQYRHPHNRKQLTLALGAFPDVSLKQARDRRDDARKLLADGIDPGEARKAHRTAKIESSANTFAVVADELLAKKRKEGRAPRTLDKAVRLHGLAKDGLGSRPIADITAAEVLGVLRKIEARGTVQVAHQLRGVIGAIFRHGASTARCKYDPTVDLKDSLPKTMTRSHPAIVEPHAIGGLLRSIDGYSGAIETRTALQVMALTAARPGELGSAEWHEIDVESGLWTIPAAKAKKRREHVIPLSRQALDLLRQLKSVSSGNFVFSAKGKPLGEATMNAALRRMGYDGNTHVAHGFRTTFSTRLNASRQWHPDLIEQSLAHRDKNQIRAVYNRADDLEERRQMMQAWANTLDSYRAMPPK